LSRLPRPISRRTFALELSAAQRVRIDETKLMTMKLGFSSANLRLLTSVISTREVIDSGSSRPAVVSKRAWPARAVSLGH
jgi:hypothetical protein